jgi:hypothetical protein
MSINRVILSGQVSSYGPKIESTAAGKRQTAFTLVLLEGSLSWKAGRMKDAGCLQVVAFDVEILVKAIAPVSAH